MRIYNEGIYTTINLDHDLVLVKDDISVYIEHGTENINIKHGYFVGILNNKFKATIKALKFIWLK